MTLFWPQPRSSSLVPNRRARNGGEACACTPHVRAVSAAWSIFRNSPLGCFLLLVSLSGASARADTAQTYLDCLADFQRYGDSIWHAATYSNARENAGLFGDGNSTGNGGIRGSCGVAVA